MSDRSCLDCAFFISEDEGQEVLQRPLAKPTCMKFHIPIAPLGPAPNPTSEQDIAVVAKRLGSSCKEYVEGKRSYETAPAVSTVPVVLGADVRGADVESVSSCNQCSNFISVEPAFEELGIPVPICGAKGIIVYDTGQAAKDCKTSVPGIPDSDLAEDLSILPIWLPLGSEPTKEVDNEWLAGLTESRPVDEASEDDSEGITGWLHVVEPPWSVEEVPKLPVYDPSYFTEEQQKLIPRAGDNEHPDLYVDYSGLTYVFAVDTFILDDTIALIGEPGLGKTEGARHLAYLMQVPFRRISLTENSDPDDILGIIQLDANKGTHFTPGRLTKAYSEPGILLLDEPNVAPDAIWQTIRPITDNSKQLVVEHAQGKIIERHPHCWVILAMNPSWNARNLGTKELAEPDANRLTPFEVVLPPEEVEKAIIQRRCQVDGFSLPEGKLHTLMKIAADLRVASDQGTFPSYWGIRQQIKVARKLQFHDFERAFSLAVLNWMDPDTRRIALQTIRLHV